MIYLYKSTANTVSLTLDESATTSTYDVLFKFVNELTGESKVFAANDTFDGSRCNTFVITESNTENLYNATVKLESGQWTYTAYQMPVSSPNSIDINQAVKVLEIGRVTVYESDSQTLFDDNEDKNSVTFE